MNFFCFILTKKYTNKRHKFHRSKENILVCTLCIFLSYHSAPLIFSDSLITHLSFESYNIQFSSQIMHVFDPFFSLFFLVFCSSVVDSTVISTSFGQLDGDEIGEFHLFKKVPFAKPPLGELRFQRPEPANSWTGIRNAKGWKRRIGA